MKKIISLSLVVVAGLLFLTGCDKVKETETGNYKEGTYFGSVETESYGKKYVTTAVVYVNDSGLIKSVFIDSTYVKDEVNTTKKVLGDDYAMKDTSAGIGVIPGGAEWYEQIAKIEEMVIAEQNMEWAKLNADDKFDTDVISGVTITVDGYVKAIEIALRQAK